MKKILVVLLLGMVLLSACGDKSEETVTGKIINLDEIDGEYKAIVKIDNVQSRILTVTEEEFEQLQIGQEYTIED